MNTSDINSLLFKMRATASLAQGGMQTPPVEQVPEVSAPNFSNLLRQSIDAVNQLQQNASGLATAFERGVPGVDIPEVMVASQKANISFQAMTQMRNKLVSAYQEIMSMQV